MSPPCFIFVVTVPLEIKMERKKSELGHSPSYTFYRVNFGTARNPVPDPSGPLRPLMARISHFITIADRTNVAVLISLGFIGEYTKKLFPHTCRTNRNSWTEPLTGG